MQTLAYTHHVLFSHTHCQEVTHHATPSANISSLTPPPIPTHLYPLPRQNLNNRNRPCQTPSSIPKTMCPLSILALAPMTPSYATPSTPRQTTSTTTKTHTLVPLQQMPRFLYNYPSSKSLHCLPPKYASKTTHLTMTHCLKRKTAPSQTPSPKHPKRSTG